MALQGRSALRHRRALRASDRPAASGTAITSPSWRSGCHSSAASARHGSHAPRGIRPGCPRRLTGQGKASKRVLVLFSGPYKRPDGLASYLAQHGLDCAMVDSDTITGGGAQHDLSSDRVYHRLVERAGAGEFLCILAAPPCSTFSVSRHFEATGTTDGGPPIVRTRLHPAGLPEADLPAAHRAELKLANLLVDRTVGIIRAGAAAGSEFILVQPADRAGEAEPAGFLTADHGSSWRYTPQSSR